MYRSFLLLLSGERLTAPDRDGPVAACSTRKRRVEFSLLVAGSGITFAERGSHVLSGPADEWPLFAMTGLAAPAGAGATTSRP